MPPVRRQHLSQHARTSHSYNNILSTSQAVEHKTTHICNGIHQSLDTIKSMMDIDGLKEKTNKLGEVIHSESIKIANTDLLLIESHIKSKQLAIEQEQLYKIRHAAVENIKALNKQHEKLLITINDFDKSLNYYNYCKNVLSTKPEASTVWFLTDDPCPICMEHNKVMAKLNHCQHLVCEDCIKGMFKSIPASKCPICRRSF